MNFFNNRRSSSLTLFKLELLDDYIAFTLTGSESRIRAVGIPGSAGLVYTGLVIGFCPAGGCTFIAIDNTAKK
jgi:hypothetical protein